MKLLSPCALLLSAIIVGSTASVPLQAQWNPYDTQGYGSVFSVTTGPGAIYMVSYGSGVIKSVNGGGTWAPSNNGLPSLTTIESVYYNGSQLFCGTHSGVYKSIDAGASWTLASTGLPASSAMNCVKKFYHYNGSIFAIFSGQIGSGSGGIWRSTDNGAQWYSGNGGLSSNMTVHQVAAINGILYTATSTGILTSSNLAVTWTAFSNSNFAAFAIQGTASRIVAITTFGYRYRVMQPTMGNWIDATGDPSTPTGGALILYDGKYWALSGTGEVTRSTDNGATYTAYESGLLGADVITQYCFHASGTTLYLGALSNLYGTPGTTTEVDEASVSPTLPIPYPTLFAEGFTVDLSDQGAGKEIVLVDASGREVEHRTDLPAAPVRFERGVLPSGAYRVFLLDRSKGARFPLGTVIAQ